MEDVIFCSQGNIVITDNIMIKNDSRGFMVGLQDTKYPDYGFAPRLISLEPGAVRGNHYHEFTTEFLIVLNGSIYFATRSDKRQEVRHVEVEKPVLFILPPKIPHAIKNEGNTTVYLYHHADKAYDINEPDTYASIVIEPSEAE